MNKKYNTEEERKAAIRESQRKYREAHPSRKKEYIEEHGEEAWLEHTKRRNESNNKWRKKTNYQKVWLEKNPDKKEAQKKYKQEYLKEYKKTKTYRAGGLVRAYRQMDKLNGLNPANNVNREWIEDNIFTSHCVYCGESDWHKLGCDRIDNSKPHTQENIVCSCALCNIRRSRKGMSVPEYIEYCKSLRK